MPELESTGNLRHVRRTKPFTIVDNSTINNSSLSFKGLGMLVYLASKPDGWRVNYKQLQAAHQEGKEAVLSGLKELEAHGYLYRGRSQNSDGTWFSFSELYEFPADNPHFVTPSPGKPSSGNPAVGDLAVGSPELVVKKENVSKVEQEVGSKEPTRKRDVHWDAMVAGLKLKPTTPATQKRFGKCKKQLVDAGASPEDILLACENYRMMWPKMTLTPEALVKHYELALAYVSEVAQGNQSVVTDPNSEYWQAEIREQQAKSQTSSPYQQSTLPTGDPEFDQSPSTHQVLVS